MNLAEEIRRAIIKTGESRFYFTTAEAEQILKYFKQLQAELKRAREALRFYADETNYTPAGVIGKWEQDGMSDTYIEDRGRRAKQALEGE